MMRGDGASILRCDLSGTVTAILVSGLAAQGALPGKSLALWVDSTSLRTTLDFLVCLRRDASVRNWNMPLGPPHAGRMCRFSGELDHCGFTIAIVPADGPLESTSEVEALVPVEYRPTARRLLTLGTEPIPAPFDSLTQINNELVSAQRELAKANAALKAANDLKNRLFGILAHDLKNPLNVISGYANLLEQILESRISQKEMSWISSIRSASCYMLDLIADTLSMAVANAGHLTIHRSSIDLSQLLKETGHQQAEIARLKDVGLELEAPPQPFIAAVDRQGIRQVLHNLITNAIKFSHPGGKVTVALEAGIKSDTLRLTVSDQGTGIPDDVMPHLFEPFATGHRTGTAGEMSTGLGLYICKSIISAHGGTITVTTGAGQGTCFTVTLPRNSADKIASCDTCDS